MTGPILFWMILLIGCIFIPFLYFANIAARKEKTKK